jgi:organic radical activating enzyme
MDLLNGYKQHPPFLVEIEPTEGCNLGCSFCGLRGIREKGTTPWKFMSVQDADLIASRIKLAGWNSRICFCGHGEPTLNKNLLEIIRVFRKHLPHNNMQLICNGYGFNHGIFNIAEFLHSLEEIGFNDVVFDVYSKNGDWNCVNSVADKYDVKTIGKNGEQFNYTKKKMRVALYPMQVDDSVKILRVMDNHCGSAAPQDYSEKTVSKRCEKPFRYLFVRWNGLVCLCCDDFRGQYRIGAIRDFNTIDELWNCEAFQAVRIMLMSDVHRALPPCYGCNYHSIRPGLLPDYMGIDKGVMPSRLNNDVVNVIVEHYHSNGSTTIVKRKWEK